MPQLLWVSPFSLHDRASAPARQLLNMVRSVKLLQPQLKLMVLCPTVYETTDPFNITPEVRDTLLNLQQSAIIIENGIHFSYVKTALPDFNQMPAMDQRRFVNELIPIFHSLKPDLVVVHNCDLLSLMALNLAKQCKLKTAFVLNNYIPDYFHFADVDLIVSTSRELVKHCVPAELKTPVVNLGAFMPAHGPLNQSAIVAKVRAAQKARAAAAAAAGAAGASVGASSGSAESDSAEAVSAANAAVDNAKDKYIAFNHRHRIMLVDPSVENGLAIFLELYKRSKKCPELKSAQFAVLEQIPGQFAHALAQYHRADDPNSPAYDLAEFAELQVISARDDRENQLLEEVRQCRVLVMPSLYSVLTCEAMIEALSYGALLVTTEQDTLKEFLGSMATYIDVEQEVVDHIRQPPSSTEVDKWLQAVIDLYRGKYERSDFIEFFSSNYVYEACMLRLSLSLKQLLDQCAGNNPQLLRSCPSSLRYALEKQASAAAFQAAAEGISPQREAKSE